MNVAAHFIDGSVAGVHLGPEVTLPPVLALAGMTPTDPTRTQIILFMALGLVGTLLAIYLYRQLYGFCLERNWPVGYALGYAQTLLLAAAATIWLAVCLHLWPQTWSRAAWYAVAALWVVETIFFLVGMTRRNA